MVAKVELTDRNSSYIPDENALEPVTFTESVEQVKKSTANPKTKMLGNGGEYEVLQETASSDIIDGDEVFNLRGEDNENSTNTELLAGGEVSTTNRSGDGIRQQGENSAKLRSLLGNVASKQRANDSSIRAGESSWLGEKRNAQSEAQGNNSTGLPKSFHRRLSRIKPKNKDTAGRIISDKTLKDKIKSLFVKDNSGNKPTSLSEIVKLIEKEFTVPISKGKFRQKAYGIYKNKSQAIRTKVTNALPTIAHELGHYLDNKYHLRNFESIGEAERVLKETRPAFYNSYKPMARPREAVAEFMQNIFIKSIQKFA